jgi:hypothetical protein
MIARQEEAADPSKFKVERRGHFAEVIDAYFDPEMVDRMFKGRPLWDDKPRGSLTSLPTTSTGTIPPTATNMLLT